MNSYSLSESSYTAAECEFTNPKKLDPVLTVKPSTIGYVFRPKISFLKEDVFLVKFHVWALAKSVNILSGEDIELSEKNQDIAGAVYLKAISEFEVSLDLNEAKGAAWPWNIETFFSNIKNWLLDIVW